jgi:site-specific recombinase XerD
MTTEDCIARFEREYQGYNQISPERCRQQSKLLREFAARTGKALTEVDSSDLQEFAGALVASGLHVNTVRKKLNMIRPFISWAYAVDLIDADRYMKLRAVKDPRGATAKTLPKPYTRDEIARLWLALDAKWPKIPHHGKRSQALRRWLSGRGPWGRVYRHAMRLQLDAAIRLALDLGLRRQEIFGLSVNDLHYDNEYLVVRGKADPNTGEPKIRQVPITEHARAALKEWLEFRALMRPGHDRPWLTCWESKATSKAIDPMRERRFHTLLQDTVGEEWRWHRLRHTCGTERLRSGMALQNVSHLLGHANLQQTLGYAEVAKQDVAKDMERNEAAFGEAMGRAA